VSRSTPTPSMDNSEQARSPRRTWILVIPIVGGVLLLLTAGVLVIYLGMRQVIPSPTEETSPGIPLEVTKLTPTPTIATSPLPRPSCETIVSSGDVETVVPLPVSLTVGSESFSIVPVVSEPGNWIYPADYAGAAAWTCGTVVNYVVGLEPTPENESVLVNLRPGDEIKMALSNGTVLFFRFVEQRETAANEAGIFEQTRPRLTLILEQQDGTWQTGTADYVSETEPVQPSTGTPAQPGEPMRVGDAQVTVMRGHAERGEAGLLPGTMYYLVEFSVENAGTTSLDSSAFAMQLQDGIGNWYLLSAEASTAGEYGPLDSEIAPGATAQGTAGYVVPETLAGPTLIWTFNPRPGSELRASVSIPHETGGEDEGPAVEGQAEVTITDAFLSTSGDVLFIEGEVLNLGMGPLTVELSDVSLTSSAGIGNLRVAAPPWPWTVQPNQTQVIELQYERPDASTVLLTLLGYSFEIQGL